MRGCTYPCPDWRSTHDLVTCPDWELNPQPFSYEMTLHNQLSHGGQGCILIFNGLAAFSKLQLVSLVLSTVPLTQYILDKNTFKKKNEVEDDKVIWLMGH